MWKTLLGLVLLVPSTACRSAPPPENLVVALTGEILRPAAIEPERRAELEANLAEARAALAAHPDDEDAHVWVGRRLAYLSRYEEAIQVYTDALARFPESYRLLRHRGHRYITTRRLDRAIEDLQRARTLIRGVPDEVEPDGAPNALGIPRSTNHGNVLYHLGLAHYLQGDFDAALLAYRECMDFVTNDDMLVATTNWLYMTHRRLDHGQESVAVLSRIQPEMDVIENHAYHRLLLFYKGLLPRAELAPSGDDAVKSATTAYGLANWELYAGSSREGLRQMGEILRGDAWAAFGYIAAEAEFARRGLSSGR